jgi:predicted HTH transcriptional regulator
MLEKLISQGESSTLEFKSTVDSAQKIAKTLAAFANTRGGILLVGVADDGSIQGIVSELEEMEKIEQAALHICEPSISISYESIKTTGNQVLVIHIAESELKPHFVKDNGTVTAYVRAKDKSIPASKAMAKVLNTELVENPELLQSRNIKSLLTYLRKNESVTVKKYAKLINISEGRATSILKDLVWRGILLLHDKHTPVTYSLK